MAEPALATFHGYISTTQDALLMFECVRRGMLPKLSRRLRDEERKLIRSGQVFVFDERESGIKRWTDGLLWSPSRILLNFLVYRQIEKKSGKSGGMEKPKLGSPSSPGKKPARDSAPQDAKTRCEQRKGQHMFAESVSGSPTDFLPANFAPLGEASAGLVAAMPLASPMKPSTSAHAQTTEASAVPPRLRSSSSGSDSAIDATSFGMDVPPSAPHGVGQGYEQPGSSSRRGSTKRAADLEDRSIVGSLTNSYPFAKDGLCKKTISISVEGTTQHLISYYTVDDVRSGRLRTPSSLPEIASLSISPVFLNKSAFRFPPHIIVGPDGVPRYAGESTDFPSTRRSDFGAGGYGGGSGGGGGSSSGEASSSSNESRFHYSISPRRFSPADNFPPSYDAAMALAPSIVAYGGSGGGADGATMDSSALAAAASASTTGSVHFYSPATTVYETADSGLLPPFKPENLREAPLPHQIGGSGVISLARRASDAPLRSRSGSGRFEPYVRSPMQGLGSTNVAHQPPSQQSRRLRASRSMWSLSLDGQQGVPSPNGGTRGIVMGPDWEAGRPPVSTAPPTPVILRPSSSASTHPQQGGHEWPSSTQPEVDAFGPHTAAAAYVPTSAATTPSMPAVTEHESVRPLPAVDQAPERPLHFWDLDFGPQGKDGTGGLAISGAFGLENADARVGIGSHDASLAIAGRASYPMQQPTATALGQTAAERPSPHALGWQTPEATMHRVSDLTPAAAGGSGMAKSAIEAMASSSSKLAGLVAQPSQSTPFYGHVDAQASNFRQPSSHGQALSGGEGTGWSMGERGGGVDMQHLDGVQMQGRPSSRPSSSSWSQTGAGESLRDAAWSSDVHASGPAAPQGAASVAFPTRPGSANAWVSAPLDNTTPPGHQQVALARRRQRALAQSTAAALPAPSHVIPQHQHFHHQQTSSQLQGHRQLHHLPPNHHQHSLGHRHSTSSLANHFQAQQSSQFAPYVSQPPDLMSTVSPNPMRSMSTSRGQPAHFGQQQKPSGHQTTGQMYEPQGQSHTPEEHFLPAHQMSHNADFPTYFAGMGAGGNGSGAG